MSFKNSVRRGHGGGSGAIDRSEVGRKSNRSTQNEIFVRQVYDYGKGQFLYELFSQTVEEDDYKEVILDQLSSMAPAQLVNLIGVLIVQLQTVLTSSFARDSDTYLVFILYFLTQAMRERCDRYRFDLTIPRRDSTTTNYHHHHHPATITSSSSSSSPRSINRTASFSSASSSSPNSSPQFPPAVPRQPSFSSLSRPSTYTSVASSSIANNRVPPLSFDQEGLLLRLLAQIGWTDPRAGASYVRQCIFYLSMSNFSPLFELVQQVFFSPIGPNVPVPQRYKEGPSLTPRVADFEGPPLAAATARPSSEALVPVAVDREEGGRPTSRTVSEPPNRKRTVRVASGRGVVDKPISEAQAAAAAANAAILLPPTCSLSAAPDEIKVNFAASKLSLLGSMCYNTYQLFATFRLICDRVNVFISMGIARQLELITSLHTGIQHWARHHLYNMPLPSDDDDELEYGVAAELLFDLVASVDGAKRKNHLVIARLQTMLLVTCPHVLLGIFLPGESNPNRATKTAFVQSLQSQLSSKKDKRRLEAARCFADLYEAASYMRPIDPTSARGTSVSQLASQIIKYDKFMLETLLGIKDDDKFASQVTVDWLVASFRLDPDAFVSRTVPAFVSSSTLAARLRLVEAVLMLEKCEELGYETDGKEPGSPGHSERSSSSSSHALIQQPWHPLLADRHVDLAPVLARVFNDAVVVYHELVSAGSTASSSKGNVDLLRRLVGTYVDLVMRDMRLFTSAYRAKDLPQQVVALLQKLSRLVVPQAPAVVQQQVVRLIRHICSTEYFGMVVGDKSCYSPVNAISGVALLPSNKDMIAHYWEVQSLARVRIADAVLKGSSSLDPQTALVMVTALEEILMDSVVFLRKHATPATKTWLPPSDVVSRVETLAFVSLQTTSYDHSSLAPRIMTLVCQEAILTGDDSTTSPSSTNVEVWKQMRAISRRAPLPVPCRSFSEAGRCISSGSRCTGGIGRRPTRKKTIASLGIDPALPPPTRRASTLSSSSSSSFSSSSSPLADGEGVEFDNDSMLDDDADAGVEPLFRTCAKALANEINNNPDQFIPLCADLQQWCMPHILPHLSFLTTEKLFSEGAVERLAAEQEVVKGRQMLFRLSGLERITKGACEAYSEVLDRWQELRASSAAFKGNSGSVGRATAAAGVRRKQKGAKRSTDLDKQASITRALVDATYFLALFGGNFGASDDVQMKLVDKFTGRWLDLLVYDNNHFSSLINPPSLSALSHPSTPRGGGLLAAPVLPDMRSKFSPFVLASLFRQICVLITERSTPPVVPDDEKIVRRIADIVVDFLTHREDPSSLSDASAAISPRTSKGSNAGAQMLVSQTKRTIQVFADFIQAKPSDSINAKLTVMKWCISGAGLNRSPPPAEVAAAAATSAAADQMPLDSVIHAPNAAAAAAAAAAVAAIGGGTAGGVRASAPTFASGPRSAAPAGSKSPPTGRRTSLVDMKWRRSQNVSCSDIASLGGINVEGMSASESAIAAVREAAARATMSWDSAPAEPKKTSTMSEKAMNRMSSGNHRNTLFLGANRGSSDTLTMSPTGLAVRPASSHGASPVMASKAKARAAERAAAVATAAKTLEAEDAAAAAVVAAAAATASAAIPSGAGQGGVSNRDKQTSSEPIAVEDVTRAAERAAAVATAAKTLEAEDAAAAAAAAAAIASGAGNGGVSKRVQTSSEPIAVEEVTPAAGERQSMRGARAKQLQERLSMLRQERADLQARKLEKQKAMATTPRDDADGGGGGGGGGEGQ